MQQNPLLGFGPIEMILGEEAFHFLGRYLSLQRILYGGLMVIGSCGLFIMGLVPTKVNGLLGLHMGLDNWKKEWFETTKIMAHFFQKEK